MVAFSIFGWNIYWYGIFYLIGFVLSYFFLRLIGKKKIFRKYINIQNLLTNDLDSLFIILILGVLIGGRLGHILIYDFHHYVGNRIEIFQIRKGGMSFIGGIIGVVLGASLFLHKKKFSKKETFILLDLLACIAPLCIALGRLGNFLNQELYGIIFTNKFGLTNNTVQSLISLGFLHKYSQIDSELRINTNFLSIIFEGITLFITLFIILIRQIKSKHWKIGKTSMIFLLRYSTIRFLLEYLRQDSQSEFLGRFSKSQRVFLGFIILGIIGTYITTQQQTEDL